MYGHLTEGTALQASQVVRATPRAGGAGQAFSDVNLPPVAPAPAADAAITFDGARLSIPD